MNKQIYKEEYKNTLHIGFDDTDSTLGRCTTHLAYTIVDILIKKFKVSFVDFPLLIRLNPNIPIKTRGNGAVCLRIKGKDYEKIKAEILYIIERYSDLENSANPGLAFYEKNNIGNYLISFSNSAMDTVLSKQLAEKTANKNGIQYHLFGKGYGLVGALSAIGCRLNYDHTFETIAYRKKENTGTERKIEVRSLKILNEESFPNTFNNFDYKKNRILIAPHGPDPVFCGIRGENPLITTSFIKNLRINEDLDGYMVFRSNQGTNLHLTNERRISDILPFTSGHINCQVITKPQVLNGGHVIFNVKDNFKDMIPVAVYKPTGLTKIATFLEIGDKVEIGYGVHFKSNSIKTLNLEYLLVKEIKEVFDFKNPICNKCGKTTKSEGKNKGFQCPSCKTKNKNIVKSKIKKNRGLNYGLYIPDPIAHRHLTKPFFRYGKEKKYHKKNISDLLKDIKWISKNSGGLI
ncbi:MAG: TiaS agmantine-binding domain-containing protein [Candidatus Nitrosocosmicus sp.]